MRALLAVGMIVVGGVVACSSTDSGSVDVIGRPSLGAGGLIVGVGEDAGAGAGSGSGSGSGTGSGTGSGSGSGSSSGSGSGSSSGGASTGNLQHCVDDINSYRATIDAPPYARSSALEQFAAAGAESDAQTGQAHGHFESTNGGNGIASAENEAPGWPISQYGGTIDGVVDASMQMMWAEGPGGGHYENMASTQYTTAGCGFYTTSSGDVWVTTDFE